MKKLLWVFGAIEVVFWAGMLYVAAHFIHKVW